MSEERWTVCDACSARVRTHDANSWLNVRCIVGNIELYESLMESDKDSIDSGDFCTLVCLANWSSARANMKSLEG